MFDTIMNNEQYSCRQFNGLKKHLVAAMAAFSVPAASFAVGQKISLTMFKESPWSTSNGTLTTTW